MFQTIKRLYAKTGDVTIVENAVKKGWITEAQAAEILGENAAQPGGGETVESPGEEEKPVWTA